MRLVVFGLSISSSWGNGHATLWRGLCRALGRRGHRVAFFERDVPYYAAHRDLRALPGLRLVLYHRWEEVEEEARRELHRADVGMVTSFCPDGLAAGRLLRESPVPTQAFYDLDTPVTLERLDRGEPVPWLGPEGLVGYDVVLSYTGGPALDALRSRLGAAEVAPLYGHVDPGSHRPSAPRPEFAAGLSYLGTFAADRQAALEALFLEPARRRPDRWFVIGGSLYPEGFPWRENVKWVPHVAPADHPAFFSSSPLTVNVTRGPMAAMGWCPSGRLFEAAACGTPVLSDAWPGLEEFFEPGKEILLAGSPDEALEALALPAGDLQEIARAARARVLDEHTSERRAETLLSLLRAEVRR